MQCPTIRKALIDLEMIVDRPSLALCIIKHRDGHEVFPPKKPHHRRFYVYDLIHFFKEIDLDGVDIHYVSDYGCFIEIYWPTI